ncbi:MAG TPA: hypothetical protein VGK61_10375 [Planctomycetota bacterium]
MALFGLFLLPAGSQEGGASKEPPRITWEETDDFRILLKELELKTAGRVRLAKGLRRREVKISVRDAGFYEVLDAICRAHKEATYTGEEWHGDAGELTVGPGAWEEFPASYHGHFKTAVVSMMRHAYRAPDGEGARVDVRLKLFGPPWIPVTEDSGAEVEWKIEEARDAEGRDLLAGREERYAGDRIDLSYMVANDGNSLEHLVPLRDFDLTKGLKVIAGTVKVKVAEAKVERIAVEVGRSFELGAGTITVKSVKEGWKYGPDSRWNITLTFKPKEGKADPARRLDKVFEPRVRQPGGQQEWGRLGLPWKDGECEVETFPAPKFPAWIELRVRGEERLLVIPFRIRDAAFKGD